MTIEQFRQMPPYVQRMRELLADDTMQQGLMALHDSNLPSEPTDAADAIASVRRHSRGVGFNNAIAALLSLADPMLAQVPEEEASYEVP